MYFDFKMVDLADGMQELRIARHEGVPMTQHTRIALSQKLAKTLGFDYRSLPMLAAPDVSAYYAVTSEKASGDLEVIMRNAMDNEPEAFVVADWESYLEGGEGEFGPFLFAMFDEWLHVPEARDLYQISSLEFENQSSGPWAFYQAPREITKQMVADNRDFDSELRRRIQETVNKDLYYDK
ncbi:hypothetical protein ABNZ43_06615 [Weissella sp. GP1]|uniref:hypothetical protein n=1 Tax=Weissella confusa TaxID=1583 RepID=UPI0032DAD3DD